MSFLNELNKEQKQSVTAHMGPVLVLAGAGSGKTRVLTFRIAYLIDQGLFQPEDILALTFTNKAAGEMKERIIRLTQERTHQRTQEHEISKFIGSSVHTSEGLTMGTFHAVCAKILRSEIANLQEGYDQYFVIYDSDDSLKLIKQIVLEMGIAENFRPQVFAYYISQAKNRLSTPMDLDLDNEYLEQTLLEVYSRYQNNLRERNALDFDDLLALTCRIYLEQPKILRKYQNKFKYILVDEYQDTNHAQYTMLKLLALKHHNLFVVGDDAQSIYGFRGANMQNILNFKKDYPKSKIFSLTRNYRSTQSILNVAARIILLNKHQYEKKLWTENGSGDQVHLYEAMDEMDESRFVLRRIMDYEGGTVLAQENKELEYVEEETPILSRFMRRDRGVFGSPIIYNAGFEIPNLNDSVILYRTHAQSRPFEETLLQAGIPYQIIGGLKFYERREVKDVLSYLRLILNPKDLVSMSRIINIPPRGIGTVSFREIAKILGQHEYSYEAIFKKIDGVSLASKAKHGFKDFLDIMVRAQVFPQKNNLHDLGRFLLNRSGYKESLLAQGEEGEGRWENIEELFNVAAKFNNLSWREGLVAFLQETALMTDLDSMDEGSANKLTLMTLHSAKGLEFENVYFVGLEEGLLPHSRSLFNPEEIAEEIRLAYVGMTRAKKKLYLSYAMSRQTFGELKRCVPSRIIKAIPKNMINKLTNKQFSN